MSPKVRDRGEDDDAVPAGVCTALGCKCSHFTPRGNSRMYCAQPDCGHSVEHHHLSAKAVRA